MKKVEWVKTVGGIIVSVGVGAIVGNAVKATSPEQLGGIKKLCVGIGSFVLSSMIGDAAVKYTGEKIDSAVTELKKMADDGELS
jgi:hypothetical protein